MAKKKFNFDEFFASRIVRVITPKKEYLCALVHRKYGDDDVEVQGGGDWVGYTLVPQFKKITDTDKDSETFGQRIDDTSGEPIGHKPEFSYEFNKTNIENFKKLVGNSSTLGETLFVYRIDNNAYRAGNLDEFWGTEAGIIRDEYTKANRTVVIKDETTNSNTKRKSG